MERLSLKIESRENPKELVKVFYLFRHDPPVYGQGVDDEMKRHGYSRDKNYSAARIGKPNIPTIADEHLPSKEKLNSFSKREIGSKMIGRNSDGGIDYRTYAKDDVGKESADDLAERAIYEGGIDEIRERKNLAFLEELIKTADFKPVFLVGPRTRHLFTFNSIAKSLKNDGVDIDDVPLFHTDKLTDMNTGWLPMMRVAGEIKADDPWSLAKDLVHHEKMKNEGMESLEDIKDRMKKHLASLERGLAIKNASEIKAGKAKIKPVFVEFTSDFEQRALLGVLGFDEIKGVKVNYFKAAPGSYICIEVARDDTAKIYYQAPAGEDRDLLGEVRNFSKIIELKNKGS